MSAVAIVDYGMGNHRSVLNAFESLGVSAIVTSSVDELRAADRLVLPGVGAFEDAMSRLRDSGLAEELHDIAMVKQRPFLGICLGMQLLAESSEEHGLHAGLGWIKGPVKRLVRAPEHRIPHIGWNDVQTLRADGHLKHVPTGACFYFVHSYAVVPTDPAIISATCEYGGESFTAALQQDNVFATQFHPEKSQAHGLSILKRFLEL